MKNYNCSSEQDDEHYLEQNTIYTMGRGCGQGMTGDVVVAGCCWFSGDVAYDALWQHWSV